MKKIQRITKCESIAKMTNDEVKIMILEKRIDRAIQHLDNLKFILFYKKLLCKCLTDIQDILKGEE